MPDLPVLYTFRRCPYAMRARMGLWQSRIELELREIILRDKPTHMLEISPKGTVPILLLPNGSVIDESLDILLYALNQNDPDNWLNGYEEYSKKLIAYNDGPFKKALDRYKYPNRYPDEDCSNARNDGEIFLKKLNAILENQKFLFNDKVTIADIAIFPFIRQFANTNREWFYALPYKPLQNWLKHHLESEHFSSIMQKYSLWNENSDPIYWPSN